jgi:hypothetical protein
VNNNQLVSSLISYTDVNDPGIVSMPQLHFLKGAANIRKIYDSSKELVQTSTNTNRAVVCTSATSVPWYFRTSNGSNDQQYLATSNYVYIVCNYSVATEIPTVNNTTLTLDQSGSAVTTFPYTSGSSLSNALIMKLTPAGDVYHYLPVLDSGGANSDVISGFTVDSDDNVYAAGYSTTSTSGIITRAWNANRYPPSVDLTSGVINQGTQAWIVVWSSAGTIQATARIVNANDNNTTALAHDNTNHALFVGMTDSTATAVITITNFNGVTSTRNVKPAYILKLSDNGYDSSGNEYLVAFDASPATVDERVRTMKLDASQNVYATVYSRRILQISNPMNSVAIPVTYKFAAYASGSSTTNYLICLVKFDNLLNAQWVATIDTGTQSVTDSYAEVLSDNNVYLLFYSDTNPTSFMPTRDASSSTVGAAVTSFAMTNTSKNSALVRYSSSGTLDQSNYLFFNSTTGTVVTTLNMSQHNDELYLDLQFFGLFSCTNKVGTTLVTVGAAGSVGTVLLSVTKSFAVSLVSYTDNV